jgi:hypothetical protein
MYTHWESQNGRPTCWVYISWKYDTHHGYGIAYNKIIYKTRVWIIYAILCSNCILHKQLYVFYYICTKIYGGLYYTNGNTITSAKLLRPKLHLIYLHASVYTVKVAKTIVLVKNLIVGHIVKNFSAFYGNPNVHYRVNNSPPPIPVLRLHIIIIIIIVVVVI